jgi:hypothetical protein
MRLYHGSTQRIETIDLGKSKPCKDFGRAFYLSEDYTQAEELASFKVASDGGECIVNEFFFDEAEMTKGELKVLTFDDYSEDWAHFIFQNRDKSNLSNVHDYDIVYGPIADDKVGRQIINLKDGYITFEMFLQRLKYMKGITFQYAFCTQKAIDKLVKI